jgi:predicted ThiF/HesA family dinucleotide-utilizing enzyme
MYKFYRDSNNTTWLVFDKSTVEQQGMEHLLEGGEYLGYDMQFITSFAESTEIFTQAEVDAMAELALVEKDNFPF